MIGAPESLGYYDEILRNKWDIKQGGLQKEP